MKKLTFKDKFLYGFGSLGYATVAQTLSNFIMFFGTSVLGISGTLMGVAVSIGVLWDAVSDPILGHYSDITTSALGKRHPYILIGTLGMCAINLIIWLVSPSSPELIKFFWILISLLLVQTFCTLFGTPYMALGFDLTKDPYEQTEIQSYKTIFYLMGMMLPSVLMFIFMPNADGQGQVVSQGYIDIAYVSSLICLITGLITFFGTLKFSVCCEIKNVKRKKLISIVNDFFSVLKKKDYRNLIIGYSISNVASSILTAAGIHMFTYCFHFNSKQLAVVMATLIFSAMFSQFFWIKKSKIIGKKNTLIKGICIALVGIFFVWTIFTLRNFIPNMFLFVLSIFFIIICGFGTGVLFTFPISLFSDYLSKDKECSENEKTGTYAGIMTLSNKLSNSISLFFIGIMLDVVKFSSSSPVQPLSVQTGLGYLVILGVALSLATSIYFYKKLWCKLSNHLTKNTLFRSVFF